MNKVTKCKVISKLSPFIKMRLLPPLNKPVLLKGAIHRPTPRVPQRATTPPPENEVCLPIIKTRRNATHVLRLQNFPSLLSDLFGLLEKHILPPLAKPQDIAPAQKFCSTSLDIPRNI